MNYVIFALNISKMCNERIAALLETHRINCSIDIRSDSLREHLYDHNTNNLKATLRLSNIIYLPFGTEFGNIDIRCYNRDGSISYKKALSNELVSQGFSRINNGLDKGFRICIIDDKPTTLTSLIVALIGRYFNERAITFNFISYTGEITEYNDLIGKFKQEQLYRAEKTKNAKKLGEKGEKIASLYLEEQGYKILAHNWNLHYGCEIDIIAFKENKLHFVEVKTRMYNYVVLPEFAVNKDKIWHIAKAARQYVRDNFLQRMSSQIDCIAIVMHTDDEYDLKFIEDIKIETTKFYN